MMTNPQYMASSISTPDARTLSLRAHTAGGDRVASPTHSAWAPQQFSMRGLLHRHPGATPLSEAHLDPVYDPGADPDLCLPKYTPRKELYQTWHPPSRPPLSRKPTLSRAPSFSNAKAGAKRLLRGMRSMLLSGSGRRTQDVSWPPSSASSYVSTDTSRAFSRATSAQTETSSRDSYVITSPITPNQDANDINAFYTGTGMQVLPDPSLGTSASATLTDPSLHSSAASYTSASRVASFDTVRSTESNRPQKRLVPSRSLWHRSYSMRTQPSMFADVSLVSPPGEISTATLPPEACERPERPATALR